MWLCLLKRYINISAFEIETSYLYFIILHDLKLKIDSLTVKS